MWLEGREGLLQVRLGAPMVLFCCCCRDLTDTEVVVQPSEAAAAAADVKQEVKEEPAAEVKAE